MRLSLIVALAAGLATAACGGEGGGGGGGADFKQVKADVDAGRCDEVTDLDPTKVKLGTQPIGEAYYLIGFCNQIARKDDTKALEYYDQALQKGGQPFWIYYNRGQLHQMRGDMVKARGDIEKAAALNPYHEAIPGLLAQVRAATGDAAAPAAGTAAAPTTAAPAPAGALTPPASGPVTPPAAGGPVTPPAANPR
jgi:tetratricopeptide (TPR) repeat protein